jgi:NitT/TauT family transport system permease protein
MSNGKLIGNAGRGLVTVASFLAVFLAWQFTVEGFGIRPVILPTPAAIANELASSPLWYLQQGWYTLLTTLGGFFLAVVVGVALSVLIVEVRFLESTLYAFILVLNTVPKVAIAPLFVIWLGTGSQPKIAIAFLIAFFAIVIDTVLGLKSVPPEMLDLASTLRGSRWGILRRIRFPCALPSMFAGMKVAMSLSLVGAIVGEFVASERGLGYVILAAQGTFDTTRVFAAITVLALGGIVLFWFLSLVERRLLPWHTSQQPRH